MPYTIQTNEDGLPYLEVGSKQVVLGSTPSNCDCQDFCESVDVELEEANWIDCCNEDQIWPHELAGLEYLDAHSNISAVAAALSLEHKHDTSYEEIADLITESCDCYTLAGAVDAICGDSVKLACGDDVTITAFKLKSFEELRTAVACGFPCVANIAVGGNFLHSALREDGVAALPNVIVGIHPVVLFGLTKVNERWTIKAATGWGPNWGLDGCCYLQAEHWSEGYGCPFEAYAFTITNLSEDEGGYEDDSRDDDSSAS